MTTNLENLKIKIFADGADIESMIEMYNKSYIKGLTTNPTLMNKAGVKNYRAFALDVLSVVKDKPISFEVFSDDFDEMIIQAKEIASWGSNVNVKIPITNSKGQETASVIRNLSNSGVIVNVTAVMTITQVAKIIDSINTETSAFISIFAGRIADTGVDPQNTIRQSVELISNLKNSKILWASPREILNIFHAVNNKCHIITATKDILDKIPLLGKDLKQYSKETVEMFYNDALQSNFEIS
jgi:transaldolase